MSSRDATPAFVYSRARKNAADVSNNIIAQSRRPQGWRQCVVINCSLGLDRLLAIPCLSIQGIIDSPQVQTSRLTVINHAVSDLIIEYTCIGDDTKSYCLWYQSCRFAKHQWGGFIGAVSATTLKSPSTIENQYSEITSLIIHVLASRSRELRLQRLEYYETPISDAVDMVVEDVHILVSYIWSWNIVSDYKNLLIAFLCLQRPCLYSRLCKFHRARACVSIWHVTEARKSEKARKLGAHRERETWLMLLKLQLFSAISPCRFNKKGSSSNAHAKLSLTLCSDIA